MAERLLFLYQGAGFIGFVFLAGGVFAQEVLFLGERTYPRLRWGMLAGALTLLAGCLGLCYGTVQMMMGTASMDDVATFVSETHPGRVLVWRSSLVVLLVLVSLIRAAGPRRLLEVAAAVSLAGTFTAVSHAGLVAGPGSKIADALHLLAAACWAGLLWYFAWIGPGLFRSSGAPASMIDRLSNAAMGSVVVLGLTGVYGAWLHLPTLHALWSTDWGRILLWKLGVLGFTLALAGYNRWRLVPLKDDPGIGLKLCKTVLVESVAVVMILALTAVLTRTDPPHTAGSDESSYQAIPCLVASYFHARPGLVTTPGVPLPQP